MTDACHPRHELGDADFTITVRATPAAVSDLTQRAGRWFREARVDPARESDIMLATYEALANCADHAYRDSPDEGSMTLEVTIDDNTVRVCITDGGRWVDPETQLPDATRGRGLRLMQALCDEFTVNGTGEGTTVCLHFQGCIAGSPPPNEQGAGRRAGSDDSVSASA
jgi:serine/threonine-protein kinase RsbW